MSIDPRNAPIAWPSDIDDALNQLSRATGLHFQPVAGDANINISWATALLAPHRADKDTAGVTSLKIQPQLIGMTLRSAAIQVSSSLIGNTTSDSELPVLLHELGHAVGLSHYKGPQVMNPVDQGYVTYQAGDLAGLAALYQPASCQ